MATFFQAFAAAIWIGYGLTYVLNKNSWTAILLWLIWPAVAVIGWFLWPTVKVLWKHLKKQWYYDWQFDPPWFRAGRHIKHFAVCGFMGHDYFRKMDGTRLCRRRP